MNGYERRKEDSCRGDDLDEMCRIMAVIVRTTAIFDKACGFERHHKKTESFGTSAKACEAVTTLQLGPARKVTTILGVQYTLAGRRRNRTAIKKFSEAQNRLRRIPIATKQRLRREKAIRSWVLPVIRWSAPWAPPPQRVLKVLGSAVERAVIGTSIVERSRFLAKAVQMAPSLDPQHACGLEAMRLEQLWAKEVYKGTIDPAGDEVIATSWKEISNKWEWRRRDHGSYATPEGPVTFGMEGTKTLQRLTDAAFQRWMLKAEPRAQDPASQALIKSADPVTSAHKDWMDAVLKVRAGLAVAVGAGQDSRILNFKRPDSETPITCQCGEEFPSRRHITWHCRLMGCGPGTSIGLAAPAAPIEEGLCIPFVARRRPRPEYVAGKDMHTIVAELRRQQQLEPARKIYVATEGGADGRGAAQKGAFAVVTGNEGICDIQPGHDQSAPATEQWAAYQAIWAIAKSGVAAGPRAVEVHLIIDNLMTVRGIQQLLRGQLRGGSSFRMLCPEMQQLLPGLKLLVDWVPSHGKHPEWKPPAGECPLAWRALNEWADRLAALGKNTHVGWRLDKEAEIERAKHRAHVALLTQFNGLEWLAQKFPPDEQWKQKVTSKKRGAGAGQQLVEKQLLRDADKAADQPKVGRKKRRPPDVQAPEAKDERMGTTSDRAAAPAPPTILNVVRPLNLGRKRGQPLTKDATKATWQKRDVADVEAQGSNVRVPPTEKEEHRGRKRDHEAASASQVPGATPPNGDEQQQQQQQEPEPPLRVLSLADFQGKAVPHFFTMRGDSDDSDDDDSLQVSKSSVSITSLWWQSSDSDHQEEASTKKPRGAAPSDPDCLTVPAEVQGGWHRRERRAARSLHRRRRERS